MPWAPLAAGFLARPLSSSSKRSETETATNCEDHDTEANFEINRRVEEIARKKEVSMARLALAWVMHKDGTLQLLSIPAV